ncbi:MAG: hypothetical protein LBL79_03085 [Prevotella sp.]|jgi:hypothetical protein|nr:hypothetical protein [Prevotella sp.]
MKYISQGKQLSIDVTLILPRRYTKASQRFFYSCQALAAPCALRAGNPSGEKGVKWDACLSLKGEAIRKLAG